MTDSSWWWLLAGAAVAVELITGTFYLLMLSIGLAAGALAAHAGASLTVQIAGAAVVGTGALLIWQSWRGRHPAAPPAQSNADVNLDIGQTVKVSHWHADRTAHVQYRGADWTVILKDGTDTPSTGTFRIVAVEGSRLVVQAI